MSADPTVFLGRVDEHGVIHLDFPQRQRAYCKAKMAGKCVDVIITEQGDLKSRLQEKGFHAMISPWARDAGMKVDALKRDLLGEIFGWEEHDNMVTGEVRMELREPHTSKLSRTKYSELIERSADIAAECGFILELPHEYRERKEREQKQAAKPVQPRRRRDARSTDTQSADTATNDSAAQRAEYTR